MAHPLLLREKDKVTTKYQLALFTSSVEDNLVLAKQVAQLEMEAAQVSIAYHDTKGAFKHLVSAAVAYRTLGRKYEVLSCLERARNLGAAGDSADLLEQAIADVKTSIQAARVKPAPKAPIAPPAAKKEAPPKPREAPKLKEEAEEAPKVEKKAVKTTKKTVKTARPRPKATKDKKKD